MVKVRAFDTLRALRHAHLNSRTGDQGNPHHCLIPHQRWLLTHLVAVSRNGSFFRREVLRYVTDAVLLRDVYGW